ncbi:uncharacterized protein N7529_010400 [Penicillium soppii]|uniref:uncharacterized protein n=1 Tax=Penicillium soppii TaxID=69789 RepID=UPI002548C5B4|nr:uncharacterized protein N7529_010400 [Penicillium soppii]KAJ5856456.1 hypothetical protein N7529_010400 [Penicillium soppii]
MSTKVAIVGASGNVGPAVLEQLLVAGFDVTVLTRSDSDKKFDSRAQIAKVDYESFDSLKDALANQDVVVSTLNVGAVPLAIHSRIIDAAAATGVKRFIPSEYGCDTTNAQAAKLPVFGDKVKVQEHLKNTSQTSGLSYSLLITGPFLDWGIEKGFILDTSGPVVTLYDGGEQRFSTTTLNGVGKGVVGIINNLDSTKNIPVYVEEARVSQKDLLRLSGSKIDTQIVQTVDLEKGAFEELGKPSPNPAVFATKFILRSIFGEGFGSLFDPKKLSNDLFGLKPLSEEELRGLFAN